MTQTLLMDFDWTTALVRFSINTIFIASMIFIISRQTVLKRFSFTFMMISLIVFFLCYTLKNFDLNLGMALGLFAIFGIIRYRTLPLQTEEMTYLFVTIFNVMKHLISYVCTKRKTQMRFLDFYLKPQLIQTII